jgi:hypothetical protein
LALHAALSTLSGIMLRSLLSLCCILGKSASLLAGTLLTHEGVFHDGEVTLDRGVMVRADTVVKLAMSNVLLARFGDAPVEDIVPPGLVLTSGARLAGDFGSLADSPVRVGTSGLRIPESEIAWAVYTPFPGTLATEIPSGKTGALLPAGDFYEGTPRGADGRSARVLNSVFGPRTFTAAASELHALVLREIKPQPAVWEVFTKDGSRLPALDVLIPDNAAIVLRASHYNNLRIPASEVVEIRAAASRMVPLDAVKPRSVSGKVTLREANGNLPRLQDRAVRACRMEGASNASWTMPLGGGVFIARAAVAAGDENAGNMTFVVQAGGRELLRSAPIPPGSKPLVLRCALPAAEVVTLRVEGAGTAYWLDPVILTR